MLYIDIYILLYTFNIKQDSLLRYIPLKLFKPADFLSMTYLNRKMKPKVIFQYMEHNIP